jgi:hypothetical protein
MLNILLFNQIAKIVNEPMNIKKARYMIKPALFCMICENVTRRVFFKIATCDVAVSEENFISLKLA